MNPTHPSRRHLAPGRSRRQVALHHGRHEQFDVIVVGARASGAATALLLARAGLSVLVVDRSRAGSDTLSTNALMRGGVMQLQRWGLLDQIVDAGTPPIRRSTFRYADETVAVSVKPSHGVDALYAPRRTVLDPALARAAMEAGAVVRYGASVVDLRRDLHGRVVGVVCRNDDGRLWTAGARVVVGADGVRSVVARRVAAPVEHRGASAGAVVYGYWDELATDGYEWAFRPGVAAGLIPTNDGLTCVFAGARPDVLGAGGVDALTSVLRLAAPDFADRVDGAAGPVGVRSFAGLPGYLRRSWGPGWALVGDAGSWKDPISAHGITDALRDAELLARALIAVFEGSADERESLSNYQATRDRLTLPLMRTADTIAAYEWTEHEIAPLLLRMSSVMADEVDAIASFGGAVPS